MRTAFFLTVALLEACGLAGSAQVVPFTAKGVNTAYKPDGSGSLKSEFVFAMRADGATVHLHEVTRPSGVKYRARNIINLSEALSIGISDNISAWMRNELKPIQTEPMERDRTACLAASDAEKAMIAGFEVLHMVKKFPESRSPDGRRFYFEFDDWQAPKLNCYPLKRTTANYNDGVRGSYNVSEILQVTIGEPDAEMFAIPAHYRLIPPRQFHSETMQWSEANK